MPLDSPSLRSLAAPEGPLISSSLDPLGDPGIQDTINAILAPSQDAPQAMLLPDGPLHAPYPASIPPPNPTAHSSFSPNNFSPALSSTHTPALHDISELSFHPSLPWFQNPLSSTPVASNPIPSHSYGFPAPPYPSDAPSHVHFSEENVTWAQVGGTWRAQCPRCGKWVNGGSSMKRNVQALNSHYGGRKCKADHTAMEAETQHARATREILFPARATSTPTLSADSSTYRQPAGETSLEIRIVTPSKIRVVYNDCDFGSSSDSETDSDVPSSPNRMCPGVPLEWPHDQFFSTYPWQRHDDPKLGYRICAVDNAGTAFRIRSDACMGISYMANTPCSSCEAASAKVSRVAELAKDAPPHTRHSLLSSEQLRNKIREYSTTMSAWKLKYLNASKKCARILKQLDDYRRFLMATATYDVPRLHQLVRQAVKEKASPARIVSRIQESLAEVYRAKGFTDEDHDIGLLVLRLGGRRLLYALSQHLGIPSLRTLRRRANITKLMPSIGKPCLHETMINIKSFIDTHLPTLTTPLRTGVTIAWDEISMEETATWFPHADAVGGLCREHSGSINTRLTTFENAVSIARALYDKTVHYGKEASVIALGTFSDRIRGMFPIVISPTCKTETAEKSAGLLAMVMNAYKKAGGPSILGPIWSFASDGDANRRLMVHKLFMKNQITEDHYLYKYLGRLPGLNLQVGDDDVTGDFDWKHELKRIARLLRTLEGVTVGRTIVNFEAIRRHLRRDETRTDLEVDRLMNPADSQDVPRAIEFIDAVRSIPVLATDSNPTLEQEAKVIRAIGDMFGSFMDSFIRPQWSLTDQIIALSKFAHTSFVLFRQHRTDFMPSQLYSDMHYTLKNVLFCTAKQQDLDGSLPLYTFWFGDDKLEALFGRVRMLGMHDPNFTFKQLLDRLAAAMDLDTIFARRPKWDTGSRRLKVTRAEHVDHLNPESWRGNATACSVDLESAWLRGREQAVELLRHIGLDANFDSYFDKARTTDMLRPFGDGSYPGVNTHERDRSEDVEVPPKATAPAELATPQLLSPGRIDNTNTTGSEAAVGDTGCSTFGLTEDEVEELLSPRSKDHYLPSGEDSEGDTGVDLEDRLEEDEDEDSDLRLPSLPGIIPAQISHWLDVNGDDCHKASICRIVITPDWIRKCHERPWRIRCFTADTKSRDYTSDDITTSDSFLVGDLFASLVRCGDMVCLGIFKCIVLEEKGRRVEHVSIRNLSQPAAAIRMTGQILSMKPVPSASTLSALSPSAPSAPSTPTTASRDWYWTGNFARFASPSQSKQPLQGKGARKTLIVKIPSHRCEPINARICNIQEHVPEDSMDRDKTSAFTWVVSEEELGVIADAVWEAVKRHGEDEKAAVALPRMGINDEFPYRRGDGTVAFVANDATLSLRSSEETDSSKFRCYQCYEVMEKTRARAHVGKHILKALRNVHEDLPGRPVGTKMPCGFCGRSGIEACSKLYLTKGRSPQVKSECPHAHKFQYRASLESTRSTPSTNTPVVCPLEPCNAVISGQYTKAIWKYNMPEHVRTEHPGYATHDLDEGVYDKDLLSIMELSAEEERAIGIPTEKIPRKSFVGGKASAGTSLQRTSKRPSQEALAERVVKRVRGLTG